MNIKYIIVCM